MATALDATHRMKSEALHMKESLLRGDLRGFFDAINACWEAKKQTAGGISNASIEAVYRCAMEAGARGGKVSGAGGGGVMMFFVDPERRMQVSRALERYGKGQVLTCHFTQHGTQGWKIL